ncbi:MAG: hypothetical protein HY290_23005 [Planctomycetia bacterium]|nr:hypothetical protein [Planctomycetia bacterium]
MSDSMREFSEPIADENDTRRWTDRIWWGAMLPLAWLIYELTAQPSFAIVVACAKFGWNDFLTAHWLLRSDADRGRGKTCFWMYVASGLWKITVAAFVVTGCILILAVVLAGNGKIAAPAGLIDVGLTAVIGITLLAIVPLVGVLHARMYGIKVWIDSSVHEFRRQNVWPPRPTGFNATMGLLFPSLLVPVVVTALLTFRLGVWSVLACVFGEGLYIWMLFRSVAAYEPADCWEPESELALSDNNFQSDDLAG